MSKANNHKHISDAINILAALGMPKAVTTPTLMRLVPSEYEKDKIQI
jgi:hypothetical protein